MKFEFSEDELIFSGKGKPGKAGAEPVHTPDDLPDIKAETAPGAAPVVVDLDGPGPGGVERRKRPPRQREKDAPPKRTGPATERPTPTGITSDASPPLAERRGATHQGKRPLEVSPTPEETPRPERRRKRKPKPTGSLKSDASESQEVSETTRATPAAATRPTPPDRGPEPDADRGPKPSLAVPPTPQSDQEERRLGRSLKPSVPLPPTELPDRPAVDAGSNEAPIETKGPDASESPDPIQTEEPRRIRRRLKPAEAPTREPDRPAMLLGTPARQEKREERDVALRDALTADEPAETPERKTGLASRIRAKFGGRQAPAKTTKVAQTARPMNLPSVPPRLDLSEDATETTLPPEKEEPTAASQPAAPDEGAETEEPWISPAERAAVQASFKAASHPSAKAADRFYDNLFDAHPEMEAPFLATGKRPKTMMWMTLQLLVDNLADAESLRMPMEQLGARHLAIGVKDDMYAKFADILLGTIANANEADWTDAHETGWEAALGLMVTFMRDGAAKSARTKTED